MGAPLPLDTDILIVGAGAAGLWAAGVCARRGHRTLVLEKTARAGTKVLASGGSRCNLTTTLSGRAASQLFGPEAARFISPAFKALSPQAVRARFEAMGVPTKTEPAFQKVFPASDAAVDVRDALERAARGAGAELRTHSPVLGVAPTGTGWRVHTQGGPVSTRALLLCTGGKSFPKTGTTGDAYPWLRALGLKIEPPRPALVPLTSPAAWVTQLTGLTVDAEVRVGKHRRRRPVLFTHRGLSGPGPMDLSKHISAGERALRLDLLPDHTRESLRATLVEAAGRRGAPHLVRLIPLQRRLVEAVAQQAGLTEPNPRACDLSRAQRRRLVELFKGLPVPISGTTGFDHAEVTAGGLALHQVNRKTMEVHDHPGLYVFGELLDLTGPIGGLNFQAAFATAELAALAACP